MEGARSTEPGMFVVPVACDSSGAPLPLMSNIAAGLGKLLTCSDEELIGIPWLVSMPWLVRGCELAPVLGLQLPTLPPVGVSMRVCK